MRVRVLVAGSFDFELPNGADLVEVSPSGVTQPSEAGGADSPSDHSLSVLEAAILEQIGPAFEIENWTTVCRGCGCDDDAACAGGCSWVEPDLCSSCVAVTS
jgi:hypothetical protein